MQKETNSVWPKVPPPLTERQKEAREQFMLLWHQQLPRKYGIIEKFNHGYPARLPVKPHSRTLEIGAGLGSHVAYEDLTRQEYHLLEYREEFCVALRKRFPPSQVWHGDIQSRQQWPDGYFDRVVAIHVLEHLANLPAALIEIRRLLAPDGVADIVIPCEGGMAHTLARKISAERLFKKNFGMDFGPIHKNEHLNNYPEIRRELAHYFAVERSAFFPLKVPLYTINLCAGIRLVRIKEN